MGKLRCNLDRSERDLDMQSWVEKNKPFQQVNPVADNDSVQLFSQDLDEVAHDLTLDAI